MLLVQALEMAGTPMDVETPESQEVPLSQASARAVVGSSPNVEEFEVILSQSDRLQQAVGDRVEQAVLMAHAPRLPELSAIKFAVQSSAIRNDAAERRLMTQNYKVHECLRHVVQLLTTYKDSCSGVEWFVSVYVREINAFGEAELERMHRMVSLGRAFGGGREEVH